MVCVVVVGVIVLRIFWNWGVLVMVGRFRIMMWVVFLLSILVVIELVNVLVSVFM